MKAVAGLSAESATKLAQAMRYADIVECGAVGLTPYASLVYGAFAGPIFTLKDDAGEVIGAGGWTRLTRLIWAYFADLTWEQHRELLHVAVPYVRSCVLAAGPGMPLHNMVWDQNEQAIAWLKATHCFNFVDNRIRVGNSVFLPFEAKPLEDLPGV